MSNCYRTIGFVLLLAVCGGDATCDPCTDCASEYKSLLYSRLRPVTSADKPPVQPMISPRISMGGTPTSMTSSLQQSTKGPARCETLLALDCLLLV
jgi:hypothetical protein